jgi:hypothetical protein
MRDEGETMCRSIKTLHHYAPPASDEEIRAAALQYVRKLSGSRAPSRANAAVFERAVDEIAATTRSLLDELVPSANPLTREEAAAKARARWEARRPGQSVG